MRFRSALPICFFLLAACTVAAQQTTLADAPLPQADGAVIRATAQQSTTAGEPSTDESREERAREQLREEEHQRIFGIFPLFGTSYVNNAVSLTARQKMELAFRSAADPATFAFAALVAGYHEANDDYPGYGWGAAGFGKRMGAAYLDSFDANMIGGGILPAMLHQDPRYFRLGHGSKTHRILYALGSAVICKHDNTGRWEPNYSSVGGTLAAGAISNVYYPAQASGMGQTISNTAIVLAEGAAGSVFDEFWPDLSRRFLHKDPTHGADAQAEAADRAARAAGKKDSKKQPVIAPR